MGVVWISLIFGVMDLFYIGCVALIVLSLHFNSHKLKNIKFSKKSFNGKILNPILKKLRLVNFNISSVFGKNTKYSKQSKQHSITVLTSSQNIPILFRLSFVLKYSFFSNLVKKIEIDVERKIMYTGKTMNPIILARFLVSLFALSLILCIPLGIILGIFVSPYLFTVCVLPVVFLYGHKLYLDNLITERKNQTEYELPFFAVYMSAMVASKNNIYNAVGIFLKEEMVVLHSLFAECKHIQRDVTHWPDSYSKAILSIADTHPSENFKSLIRSYIHIEASGGDVVREMQEKADTSFDLLSMNMTAKTASLNMQTMFVFMLLMAMPIMLVLFSFLGALHMLYLLSSLSLFIMPVLSMMFLFVIQNFQLKFKDYVMPQKFSILAGILTFIVLLIIRVDSWMLILGPIFSASLVNTVYTFKQFSQIRDSEKGLVIFLDLLASDVTAGKSIFDSVVGMRNVVTSKTFDIIKNRIGSELDDGKHMIQVVKTMSDEKIIIRSWTARLVLFILAGIHDDGYPFPIVIQKLHDFTKSFVGLRNKLDMQLKNEIYFSYASPVIMVFMIAIFVSAGNISFLSQEESRSDISFSMPIDITGIGDNVDEIIASTAILFSMSLVCMGILISKITYGTIKNTTHLTVISGVGMISLFFLPDVVSFVSEMFSGF